METSSKPATADASGAAHSGRAVDLHAHSAASDGSARPSEIVELAASKGLAGIALADHDTVSGIPEFLSAARNFPSMRAVPAVEISTNHFNKEIHFVGLFIDPAAEGLNALLRKMRADRDARNALLVEKLNASGYAISMEEILKIASGESVGRPHIARVLVEKGYFKTPQAVFEKCLRRGCAAYAPRVLPSPREAIDAIHSAGGLAIWAHPVYRQPSERSYVKRTLKRLVPLGLDGMETYYSLFSQAQREMLLELAAEHKILCSGGSDYHGLNQPGIELGSGAGDLFVPEIVLERLFQAWQAKLAIPPQAQQPGICETSNAAL